MDLVAGLVAGFSARPQVLAIDGPSGAGTTTLADAVAGRLGTGGGAGDVEDPVHGVAVVHGDDFYRDMPEDVRWALTAEQGLDRYFDWQRLRREALAPLRSGAAAAYRPFSWRPEGGLSAEFVTIEAAPIVVLEGVYAARPELDDLVDLTVFVETPAAERRRRLVARGHGNDRWWSRWDAAEDLYFGTVRPRDRFDLVVPGF